MIGARCRFRLSCDHFVLVSGLREFYDAATYFVNLLPFHKFLAKEKHWTSPLQSFKMTPAKKGVTWSLSPSVGSLSNQTQTSVSSPSSPGQCNNQFDPYHHRNFRGEFQRDHSLGHNALGTQPTECSARFGQRGAGLRPTLSQRAFHYCLSL